MKKATFDLEEARLAKEIRKRKAKRVLVQLPEGLKPYAPRLVAVIENAGAQTFVSADPCYGACDLPIQEAQALQADLIIHYGHTPMTPQTTVPVIYFEAKAEATMEIVTRKALQLLKPWQTIGLVTTIQHIQRLPEVKDLLLKAKKKVAIGDAGRLEYPGQVTGCELSNARAIEDEADAFLFVGGGRFHAIGVIIATSRPTIVADPYENVAFSVENEARRIRRQRMTCISEAKKAETFGILVGLKPGQAHLEKAISLKNELEKKQKKTVLFALREITPEALMQFPTIDAFVNTACSRIVLDDSPMFSKPMLSANEALVSIGKMDWETLCRRGWFEN